MKDEEIIQPHKEDQIPPYFLDPEELKRLERIKSEVISIVSHELRTPLTAIHGALKLLLLKPLTLEENRELIALAYRNSERLTQIVNDMLEVEKTELGFLSFNFKEIDIAQVVGDAIETSIFEAEKYKVKLVKEGSFVSARVKGDEEYLSQVVDNLISNAVKFSPKDSTVFISMEKGPTFVRVSVRDEGNGIPEEFQPLIFQKFTQAASSLSRTTPGLGLGLALCKNIIEGHKGRIQFKTKKGLGTTFYFELPLASEEK